MRTLTVNENDAGQRLDKFVQKSAKRIPLSLVYKLIRQKDIRVNGKRSDGAYRLACGDVVRMYIPDEFFGDVISPSEYARSTVKLDVVYEDADILVVNKPAGMLCHSGSLDGECAGHDGADERGTLVFAVRAYLCSKNEYDPFAENSFAPALCNRIDRNTCGLVIAAKNAAALRSCNEMIRKRDISKYYLCAAHGRFAEPAGVIRASLRKNSADNTVSVTRSPDAVDAQTRYTVIDYNTQYDITLLEVELITGRTHQIRAHMDSIGHPLVGDGKYGVIGDTDRALGAKYQALCSYKIRFGEPENLPRLYGLEVVLRPSAVPFLGWFNLNRSAFLFDKSDKTQ